MIEVPATGSRAAKRERARSLGPPLPRILDGDRRQSRAGGLERHREHLVEEALWGIHTEPQRVLARRATLEPGVELQLQDARRWEPRSLVRRLRRPDLDDPARVRTRRAAAGVGGVPGGRRRRRRREPCEEHGRLSPHGSGTWTA